MQNEHIRDYYRFMLCNMPIGPARDKLRAMVNGYFPPVRKAQRAWVEIGNQIIPAVVTAEHFDFAFISYLMPTWHPKRPKIKTRMLYTGQIYSVA